MKNRLCYLFVFNGLADWEPGLVTVGLSNYSDFDVKTFSVDGKPVRTSGGVTILPNAALADVRVEDFDLLLLPGGELWETGGNREVDGLIQSTHGQRKPIAAICGATIALARLGIFAEVKYTSNGSEYLEGFVPGYAGEQNYMAQPSVIDQHIITANGAGMVEFAHNVFEYFELFDARQRTLWLKLYKSGGMDQELFAEPQNS